MLTRTPETEALVDVGERIRASFVSEYMTPRGPDDDRPRGMVLEGCYSCPSGYADRHELLWTDYYLFEALVLLEAA